MPQFNKERLDQINTRLEQAREDLRATSDKAVKAVRGAVTRVEQRGTDLFQELVKTGEALQKTRSKNQSKTAKAGKKPELSLDALRQGTASLLGLPTRDEVEALNKKLNSLTRKVRKIEKAATGA
ncbi:MAG: phasin family protein [Alcanivorax sp.]|nr:phasin family protein [Alcanivorax sp.]